MLLKPLAILEPAAPYSSGDLSLRRRPSVVDAVGEIWNGLQRRWRRERRRRKVGRAYDMALEVARFIPRESRVLDVGCGSGFIAHHLSAMLGASVTGLDLDETAQAPIDYRPFDGTHFPVADKSFDGVLFCYVLHHAQNIGAVLGEVRRVLRPGGLMVVYEDIPELWWDRFICWTHNAQWEPRTGPCTFRRQDEWRTTFDRAGFEVLSERTLRRMRNLAHPVCRRMYVLKLKSA
jgi:ubiquinone/menaquinone biosynthesis C-methylase UbiE